MKFFINKTTRLHISVIPMKRTNNTNAKQNHRPLFSDLRVNQSWKDSTNLINMDVQNEKTTWNTLGKLQAWMYVRKWRLDNRSKHMLYSQPCYCKSIIYTHKFHFPHWGITHYRSDICPQNFILCHYSWLHTKWRSYLELMIDALAIQSLFLFLKKLSHQLTPSKGSNYSSVSFSCHFLDLQEYLEHFPWK